MARSKKKVPVKFEFKGFENINFTSEERVVVSTWIDTFKPDMADSITVLIEGGYKVGFSYSEFHDANQISATCKLQNSPYFGYCFTLIHSNLEKGVGIMRYVYDALLAENLYKIGESEMEYDW